MRYSFYILVFSVLLSACSNGEKETKKKSVEITVSILPQKYFVSKIAGDKITINVMIPAGASPATYEPTPSQLTSLSKSKLYLKIGYTGFEMAWMDKLASANDKMFIADLSEGVDLIMEASGSEHKNILVGELNGGVDPHIWLSPRNVKIISNNIYNALSLVYPEYKEEFNINLDVFLKELDTLDQNISNELSELKSRSFFIYHPSLSYFARDYNLIQLPLELGGKLPSPAHLKNLIDLGNKEHIGVVFLQMQFDQKNAEALASAINAEIVQFNPLDPDWFNQMIFISDKLEKNLNVQ